MRRAIAISIISSVSVLLAQNWATRPPRLLFRAEPEYTEEARRAGVNTTILASLVVDERGMPRDVRILRGAGFGLDESTVQALMGWRFEPATREGKPFAAPTHIEVQLVVPDRAHQGQIARMEFGLGPDTERPRMIGGEIPVNPDPLVQASLRIRFTVGRDGQPRNFVIFEADNERWANQALTTMRNWRFLPARRAGQPEEVYGLLDLSVLPARDGRQPSTRNLSSDLAGGEPQDRSISAPQLISPPAHALFDGHPQTITCRWQATSGAASYLLEWDYMDGDFWHAEVSGMPGGLTEVDGTESPVNFGAAMGRWRVWPVDRGGRRGNPSEWRTLRFGQ